MKKVLQLKYSSDVTHEELDRISRRMVGLDKDIMIIITPDTINIKELSIDDLLRIQNAVNIAISEKIGEQT